MASGKSTYWANKALDQVLGAVSYTPPANLYFALYLVAPSPLGGGTEVSGSNYARKLVSNNSSFWPPASNGTKSNLLPIAYVAAATDWGTTVAAGVFDAATAGNLLYFGTLATAQPVYSGDTAQFPAYAASFSEV